MSIYKKRMLEKMYKIMRNASALASSTNLNTGILNKKKLIFYTKIRKTKPVLFHSIMLRDHKVEKNVCFLSSSISVTSYVATAVRVHYINSTW